MRSRSLRIYLDACCYNRPFDSPAVSRNHLEAEAIITILSHVQQGTWALVASEIVEREIAAARNRDRRHAMLGMLAAADDMVKVGQAEYDRSMELMALGMKRLDALHVACAEAARCDVLLTTDDPLLRVAARNTTRLGVDVRNPLDWLLEQEL